MKASTAAILLVLFLALCAGCFVTGRMTGRKAAISGLNTQTDTLYVRDTICVSTPVEIAHTIVREKRVEVPVHIHTTDTLIERVYVPREERVYRDSTYMAVVSGVDPTLDYMEIYATSREIRTTIDRPVKVKARFGYGIQGGVGLVAPFGKSITAGGYVGIGIHYSF